MTEGQKILALNKKARFQYHIVETLEAGIVLTGAEIKSVRAGGVSLAESYVAAMSDGLYLLNANIPKYAQSGLLEYDPVRPRKLLVNKSELDKFQVRVEKKGLTIVPLRIYLKRGWAKVEIALAQGKNAPDKRSAIRDREGKREAARAVKMRRD